MDHVLRSPTEVTNDPVHSFQMVQGGLEPWSPAPQVGLRLGQAWGRGQGWAEQVLRLIFQIQDIVMVPRLLIYILRLIDFYFIFLFTIYDLL